MTTAGTLKLSVSKAKTFLDCKKKFQFNYILHFPQKEFSFHSLGKLVHETLENFHLALINGSNEQFHVIMKNSYEKPYLKYKEKLNKESRKEAYELINNYLKIITQNKDNLPTFLAVEKSFAINIQSEATNILLNGSIDRVQIDPDGVLHVADYKTTKDKKYLKNDFFQLLTYAYVLYLEDPSLTKIRASYLLLRHNCQLITTEFSIEEILKVKDKFIDYSNQISEEKLWRPNPTRLCSYCSFLDHCEEGKNLVNPQPQIKFGETTWKGN